MTEKDLFRQFDFQRFAGNDRLQAVIDASHKRCLARELTDEELEYVAAAGVPEQEKVPKERQK
jgi:hypothetical protein